MRHQLPITYYLFLLTFFSSCTPQPPQTSLQTTLYIYRFSPPALIEFSADFQALDEIPFALPPNCGLFNIFPAPVGRFLAIELSCPNGQTVLLLDSSSTSLASSVSANPAAVTQPISDSDSHFLAWTPDGRSLYLKVDSLGIAHVARVNVNGGNKLVPITGITYDLAPSPSGNEFTFSFSRGLGQGSELWLAKRTGKIIEQLHADRFNYISFARYSPDGGQIAFIKIPDTPTPFTVGELWVIPSTNAQGADGSEARKLADADAGHGYAANWSPDGKRIAFVVRENPDDERADQASEALISNVYIVDVESKALTQVTYLKEGRVETPFWSPEGNTLAFNAVINDRMQMHIADLTTGEIRSLITEPACCPAWMRK